MSVILTDVDGVLLNWRDPFDAWMMRQNGIYAGGDVTVYDQVMRYNLPEPLIKTYIKQFNTSADIGFLPPLYDSVKYMKKLHEEHGYMFVVITSLSLNPHAQELRTQNLKRIFGEVFKEFVYLDTGADKDDVLEIYSKIYPGAYWLEDKAKNAFVGRKLGLESILMKHIHHKNENTRDIPVMGSWKELYEKITG
jgi:hypothetical protein